MGAFGIKITTFDFFLYLMSGIICSTCVFFVCYILGHPLVVNVGDIFGANMLNWLPEKWFAFGIFIFVHYTLGLLLSTLSSMTIECWLRKRTILKFENLISKNTYDLFINCFKKKYNSDFDRNDLRLVVTSVEQKAPDSYNTAYIFLAIYGIYRNICFAFSLIGLTTFFIGVTNLFFRCNASLNRGFCLFTGICIILLSGVSYKGYVRFYKYFIDQIVSAYINVNS